MLHDLLVTRLYCNAVLVVAGVLRSRIQVITNVLRFFIQKLQNTYRKAFRSSKILLDAALSRAFFRSETGVSKDRNFDRLLPSLRSWNQVPYGPCLNAHKQRTKK
jgi:hypothetical protein